jgi:hypothetical protein
MACISPWPCIGNGVEFGIEGRQRGGVQAQPGDATLVIDRHRGLIGDRALNVINGDVVTKHRPRVGVSLLDRRAGEADEGRLRQRIAQMPGEAVDQVILRAVGLVGDDDDIAPCAQLGHRRALGGQEFLDGGEHHPAAGHRQQPAQRGAVGRLHRHLAEDVMAALELAEQLIVEVIAGGQHHPWSAVSEPMRACRPSETTSTAR